MVSGKTLYYNSLKQETNQANSAVSIANGSHSAKTIALLPRNSVNLNNDVPVNTNSIESTIEKDKIKDPSAEKIGKFKVNGGINSSMECHETTESKKTVDDIKTSNGDQKESSRRGSVTSECSSSYSNIQNSVDLDTPKQLQRFSCAPTKSFALEECKSEISFLSETTRNSTPLNGSPNLRTNSLRFRKEKSLHLQEVSIKSSPDLRKSLLLLPTNQSKNCESSNSSDRAHIVTIQNSRYETVPIGLSQDIPDVFL